MVEESIKKKNTMTRLAPEFTNMLEEIRKHMEKFSYGILNVTNADASKLLYLKIEKFGGIEKFLKSYRLEIE